ncbi:MAG: DUF885 domain-containing protein [Polyangiaceae bacterium]
MRPILLTALFAIAACSNGPAPTGKQTHLEPPVYEPPRAFPTLTASAVVSAPIPEAPVMRDKDLAALADRTLDGYLTLQPVRSTEAGRHDDDGKWPDASEAGDATYRKFATSALTEARAIPESQLTLASQVDRDVLINQLELIVFTLDELKPAENDPLFYTAMIGDGLDPLVTREFASAETRAKSLLARLKGVPAIVEVAKKRLKAPPQLHTETAIDQNAGLVSFCESDLKPFIASVPGMKTELEAAAAAAATALKDFGTYLKKDLLPRSTGDFRLGSALFQKKLRLVLDDPNIDAQKLAADARALLDSTRKDMVATARELWPEVEKKKPWVEPTSPKEEDAVIRAVLKKLSDDHSTNDTIVGDGQLSLKAATEFVRAKDLVRVPTEECRVIEMPEYRRGVAIAYCDAAGPLEKNPQTFYAISPTPKGWKKARVDSFYQEYCKSMLDDLTVHEAMPGHFLQLMHNNEYPSRLRAVFSHGAFVEGWAVYGEWLMAKHGFGGARVRMQRQKMALRMAANTLLDFGIHAGTMDEKAALSLMMDDAFQQEAEAVGKWRRARLTSAQLTTYFYGFSMMMKLRAAAEKQPGFSERAYHDKLLSFGSPPPRHLAALMAESKSTN